MTQYVKIRFGRRVVYLRNPKEVTFLNGIPALQGTKVDKFGEDESFFQPDGTEVVKIHIVPIGPRTVVTPMRMNLKYGELEKM